MGRYHCYCNLLQIGYRVLIRVGTTLKVGMPLALVFDNDLWPATLFILWRTDTFYWTILQRDGFFFYLTVSSSFVDFSPCRKIPWINIYAEVNQEKEQEMIGSVGQGDSTPKITLSEFSTSKDLMEKELDARVKSKWRFAGLHYW